MASYQSTLPELPSGVTAQPYNTAEIVQSGLEFTDQMLNQNEQSNREYLNDTFSSMSQEYAKTLVSDKANRFLNSYGTAKVDFTLDSEWKVSNYQVDYLLPIVEDLGSMTFTQLGVREEDKRSTFNAGLGLRQFNSQFMYGANLFYDQDMSLGHKRASLGIEAAQDDWRLSSNYYVPLSSWIDNPSGNDSYDLMAQAARGYDVSLTGILPAYRPLSATVEYSKWFGDSVDIEGGMSAFDPEDILTKDPDALTMSLEWKPVPLISGSLSYTHGSGITDDISAQIEMVWQLDESLAAQLSPQRVTSLQMLNGMKKSFVRRQNNIVLNYKNIPTNLAIFIEKDIELVENSSYIMHPTIASDLKAKKYLWTGTAIGQIVDVSESDKKEPLILAGPWKEKNHIFTMTLAITDEKGSVFKSEESTITIIKDPEKQPKLILYKDGAFNNQINNVYAYVGETPVNIWWKLYSKRTNAFIIPDKIAWSGKGNILKDASQQYPEVNTNLPVMKYRTNVTFETTDEGTITYEVPVFIQPLGKAPIEWSRSDAKAGDVKETLIPLKVIKDITVVANPNAIIQPTGTISYFFPPGANTDVVSLDKKTGELTLNKEGSTQINANLFGDKNYAETIISYNLEVTSGNKTNLHWKSLQPSLGKITMTYGPSKKYDSKAISNTTDPIDYDSSDTSVATIASSGEVTLVKTGTTTISATQKASGSYLETKISYVLTVELNDVTDLKWSSANIVDSKLYDEFQAGKTITVKASQTLGSSNITYDIKPDVAGAATINSNTGVITLNTLSRSVITATQAADSKYAEQQIQCTLILKTKHSSGLAWNDKVVNNTVTKEYAYDISDDIEAISHTDNAAPIVYKMENMSHKFVAKFDLTHASTIYFNHPGTAKITATQEAYNEFDKSSIYYNLTVKKGDGNRYLYWDRTKVDSNNKLIETHGVNETFTVKANQTRNMPIVYSTNTPNVITVDKDTGEVKTKNVLGNFTVYATQLENEYFTKGQISYNSEVVKVVADLRWDDVNNLIDPATNTVEKDDYDPDFTIKAVSTLNPAKIDYYSTDPSIASINVDTATVSIKASGKVNISAEQQGSAFYQSAKIIYILHIVKLKDPNLRWELGILNSKTELHMGMKTTATVKAYSSSSSPIVYSIADTSLATINSSTGEVTTKDKLGTTKVTATVAPADPYYGASIDYVLIIEKVTPKLKWNTEPKAGDAAMSLRHDDPKKTIFAEPSASTACTAKLTINYYSSDDTIASLNSSHVLEVKQPGKVVLTAESDPNPCFIAEKIVYDLTIDPADFSYYVNMNIIANSNISSYKQTYDPASPKISWRPTFMKDTLNIKTTYKKTNIIKYIEVTTEKAGNIGFPKGDLKNESIPSKNIETKAPGIYQGKPDKLRMRLEFKSGVILENPPIPFEVYSADAIDIYKLGEVKIWFKRHNKGRGTYFESQRACYGSVDFSYIKSINPNKLYGEFYLSFCKINVNSSNTESDCARSTVYRYVPNSPFIKYKGDKYEFNLDNDCWKDHYYTFFLTHRIIDYNSSRSVSHYARCCTKLYWEGRSNGDLISGHKLEQKCATASGYHDRCSNVCKNK